MEVYVDGKCIVSEAVAKKKKKFKNDDEMSWKL